MNQPGNKKGKPGLILIELLIAMAIFAISITTIFALFINATQGVIIGLEKTRGLLLSTEALEAAYAISKHDQDYLTPGKYEVGINRQNQWVLIPKTGLIAHFLLANNAKDTSIYKNHGIMENVAFAEDRKHQPFGAARFNGENSSIRTKDALSVQITGPLTISAWVMDTSSDNKTRTIAGKYDAENGGGYLLYKEGNDYFFKISGEGRTNSIWAFTSSPREYPGWDHLAGVYDSGGPTMYLYINGELAKSDDTSLTTIDRAPKIEFFIGSDANKSSVWHGLISDVRVYKRSLTANEIAGLYNSYSAPYEKNLIVSDLNKLAGIWSFNEGEGCTAHDNSGNNNHGLIKNCSLTQWVENRYENEGRAFNFEFENNNYIEIADSSTLQIEDEDEISISLWLKMPENLPEQDMTILHKRAAGSEDYSFSLIYQGAEKGYGWAASSGAPDQLNEIKLIGAAIPNRWQYIFVTFDGTNKKMYIDNREIIDLTVSTLDNPGTDSNLFIGRNSAGQNNLSGVAIDDLRIYNKILEPAERQAIFLGETNYYLE